MKRILLLSTKPVMMDAGQDVELVQVSPLVVVPRFAEVRTALVDFHRYRGVAFASAHSVDALLGGLMAAGRDVRALAGKWIGAVGEATARRLEAAHLRAEVVGEGGASALAAEILRAGVEGPLLYPRVSGGRPELEDELRMAGWTVDVVEAYDTLPDDAALQAALREHREKPFAAVAFASPRGVENFNTVLGDRKRLGGALIGAIGDTTADALREHGFADVIVPETPELASLVAALAARIG